MKKVWAAICLFMLLISVKTVSAITCDATPASTTIELGSSKKVTISCSDWGSVTSVIVEPTQYNENCLSLDKSSETITPGTTKDFTITATSMACNPYIDDRTIIWKFTPSSGTVPSKSTVVNVQSGLTISATFKQAPYSATLGGEVTIILEVSTTANEDINNIEIDTSGSNSTLISAGFTDKSISKIAASQGEKTQQVSWTITAPSVEGNYTLKAVVTSQNADSDTATATLTVSAVGVTTTTTTTPGEGAAPGIGAPPTEEERKTRVTVQRGKANITIPSIAAGKMANVSIQKTRDMAITFINIKVKNSVNNINIVIEKLPRKPATVIHNLTGKVYHYIKIDKTNIRDEDIDKATIRFRVEKSWIQQNRINESTIALYRYTNRWEKLPTRKVSEDATDVYFEAESPGLSIFAIAGEPVSVAVITTTTIPQTTTTVPITKPVPKPTFWLPIVILVIIIIAIFIYWRFYRSRSPSWGTSLR